MAKTRPIKTAILGLGRIGWNHHKRALEGRKEFAIAAVADPLAERRKEAEAELGCKAYASIGQLLKRADVELAVVATRSVDHARHTQACLKAGLHVLSEKPAAMNVKQMDAILRLAKKKRRVLTVHQNNRFADRTLYLKQLIESGVIGEVFEIKITGHNFSLRNDWQTLKKNGGGHLFNHGTHWIDAGLFLMPSDVQEVWGDMKHLVAGGDADDYFKALIRGKDGCLVDIEMSMAATYPHDQIVIMGTRGTITAGKEVAIRSFKPSRKVSRAKVLDEAAPGRTYGHVIEPIKWKEKVVSAIPRQKADFYGNLAEAIRRRKKLLITPESVREQLRVITEIRKMSAAKRGELYR